MDWWQWVVAYLAFALPLAIGLGKMIKWANGGDTDGEV